MAQRMRAERPIKSSDLATYRCSLRPQLFRIWHKIGVSANNIMARARPTEQYADWVIWIPFGAQAGE